MIWLGGFHMKKQLFYITLGTTLFCSSLSLQDTHVHAKSTIPTVVKAKLYKGKLVHSTTGKVIKGFARYKKMIYKNGRLFTGTIQKKFYVQGKLFTGISKGIYYKKGTLGTGIYKSIYYIKGNKAQGVFSGILYEDGKPFSGEKDGVIFENGKKNLLKTKIAYFQKAVNHVEKINVRFNEVKEQKQMIQQLVEKTVDFEENSHIKKPNLSLEQFLKTYQDIDLQTLQGNERATFIHDLQFFHHYTTTEFDIQSRQLIDAIEQFTLATSPLTAEKDDVLQKEIQASVEKVSSLVLALRIEKMDTFAIEKALLALPGSTLLMEEIQKDYTTKIQYVKKPLQEWHVFQKQVDEQMAEKEQVDAIKKTLGIQVNEPVTTSLKNVQTFFLTYPNFEQLTSPVKEQAQQAIQSIDQEVTRLAIEKETRSQDTLLELVKMITDLEKTTHVEYWSEIQIREMHEIVIYLETAYKKLEEQTKKLGTTDTTLQKIQILLSKQQPAETTRLALAKEQVRGLFTGLNVGNQIPPIKHDVTAAQLFNATYLMKSLKPTTDKALLSYYVQQAHRLFDERQSDTARMIQELYVHVNENIDYTKLQSHVTMTDLQRVQHQIDRLPDDLNQKIRFSAYLEQAKRLLPSS